MVFYSSLNDLESGFETKELKNRSLRFQTVYRSISSKIPETAAQSHASTHHKLWNKSLFKIPHLYYLLCRVRFKIEIFKMFWITTLKGLNDDRKGILDLVPGCYIPTLRTKERECWNRQTFITCL